MPRTTSETRISPGAERAQMRAAMLTAPPKTLFSSRMTSPACSPMWRPSSEAALRREAAARAVDGLCGRGEGREDAVAEELAVDGGATGVADGGAEAGVEGAGGFAEAGVAEALGEGGGVDDVGEEDDGGAGRVLVRRADAILRRGGARSAAPSRKNSSMVGTREDRMAAMQLALSGSHVQETRARDGGCVGAGVLGVVAA